MIPDITRPPRVLFVTAVLLTVAPPATCSIANGQNGPNSANQAYQTKLEEWKSMLKEMRSLQASYATATESEAANIERRWEELASRGDEFIRELREAGLAAYAEAPGRDRELERFLVKIVEDGIGRDRYEEAAELSEKLLRNGCEVKRLHELAGIAAFIVNDFEAAERYLAEAEKLGALTDSGRNYQKLLPEYQEYWEREKQLREAEAEADDLPRVKITTSRGEILVELLENEAPDTVANFITLVEKQFYDDLTFHRVLPGFMAQGGCPLGNGSGGPGYNIYCECHDENHRKHFRGSLSMAHAGRDTGGSQFFLTFVPTAHLNAKHTVFGRVIEGIDVLAKLQRVDPEQEDQPEPDRILKMEVLRKRDHEYQPNKA